MSERTNIFSGEFWLWRNLFGWIRFHHGRLWRLLRLPHFNIWWYQMSFAFYGFLELFVNCLYITQETIGSSHGWLRREAIAVRILCEYIESNHWSTEFRWNWRTFGKTKHWNWFRSISKTFLPRTITHSSNVTRTTTEQTNGKVQLKRLFYRKNPSWKATETD